MVNSVLIDGFINQSRLYTDNFSIRLKSKDHTVSKAIKEAWVMSAYRIIGSIASDSEGPYIITAAIQVLPAPTKPKLMGARSSL